MDQFPRGLPRSDSWRIVFVKRRRFSGIDVDGVSGIIVGKWRRLSISGSPMHQIFLFPSPDGSDVNVTDVFFEVMRLLDDADALTADTNRATLAERIEDFGLLEIVTAFMLSRFGKADISELGNEELTIAHDYINSIADVIVRTPGRVQ